ncbi:MAG: hypothetical protein JW889_05585 [Verrucomicrobia bacterium]|nr:hypothetical protein [Verrucomicrobiota bacterium]
MRVTKIYSKPVGLRFTGYIVKAGGNAQVVDPRFWNLLLNYTRGSETEIVPLDSVWHGYKLGPLEKVEAPEPGPEFPPQRHAYLLTIQRPGDRPIQLAMHRWTTTNETCADFAVAWGKDEGREFLGKAVGQTLAVNDALYLISAIGPDGVTIGDVTLGVSPE